MKTVMGSGEKLERQLQALLASNRVKGWKLNNRGLPGRPVISFPHKKLAIFVDDCFWHGCPSCRRPLTESDTPYWQDNIASHVAQDKLNDQELRARGWKVVRLWAHDLDPKKRPWLRTFLKEIVA